MKVKALKTLFMKGVSHKDASKAVFTKGRIYETVYDTVKFNKDSALHNNEGESHYMGDKWCKHFKPLYKDKELEEIQADLRVIISSIEKLDDRIANVLAKRQA